MKAYAWGAGAMPATEQEQARFFQLTDEGYHSAAVRRGELVRDFRVAGTLVRLRFAGHGLIPSIVPGMAFPLPTQEAAPPFEICLWDSQSTGVALAPPARWEDFTSRGNIWGFDSERYRCAYHLGQGSINCLDRETLRAVFWVPSCEHVPAWILASPLRTLLHWWMELNGRQLVHAAAVGHEGRAVLIPGRGGSGKSSASLACLAAGMDFISDDFLALELDPEPRVYRLFSTAKLDPRSLHLYPDLAARCRSCHQEGFDKMVLFLDEGYRDQLRESLPLHLILRPWISGKPETVLGKVDSGEIEWALASETLAMLPYSSSRTVEILDRLAREVPRASIHMGTDRAGVAAAIRDALASSGVADSHCPPADGRPYVSIVVHFYQDDRAALRSLAEDIAAQGYPRTELVVVASGAACALREDALELPGSTRFFPIGDAVVNGDAWNRGVKESFGELLLLLGSHDRLSPGALAALVSAAEKTPDAAWIASGHTDGVLRGALIRKAAFRQAGMFPIDRLLQGREHQNWLRRAEESGLRGCTIATKVLASGTGGAPARLVLRPDMAQLREGIRRLRLLP